MFINVLTVSPTLISALYYLHGVITQQQEIVSEF